MLKIKQNPADHKSVEKFEIDDCLLKCIYIGGGSGSFVKTKEKVTVYRQHNPNRPVNKYVRRHVAKNETQLCHIKANIVKYWAEEWLPSEVKAKKSLFNERERFEYRAMEHAIAVLAGRGRMNFRDEYVMIEYQIGKQIR